jgi:predicted esterase
MPVCRFFLFLAANAFLLRIGLFWERSTKCASFVVRSLLVPVFVMHGTADEIVPLSHGIVNNKIEQQQRHREKREEHVIDCSS